LLWYCAAAGALLLLSLAMGIIELRDYAQAESTSAQPSDAQPAITGVEPEEGVFPEHAPPSDFTRSTTILVLASDIVVLLGFAGVALYVAQRKPRRRTLVNLTTALIVIASAVYMIVEPIVTYVDSNAGRLYAWDNDVLWISMGLIALLSTFVVHFLGSLFMNLTLEESLRPFLLLCGIFVLIVLVFYQATTSAKVALIVLCPLAGLPGLLYSWWRSRRFKERFHSRVIQGRLGEITVELDYARRIHEALFPPPVRRGSVRIEYEYEPMRQIGGDFLYVHPLAFPPSESSTPISIVLIDVSGHGVPAALAVNRLHGELARFFAATPDAGPGKLLHALNSYACAALAPQGVFATAICLRVDPAAAQVQWASGGHPPAMVRRADGSVELLAPTAVMIGVLDDDVYDSAPRSMSLGPDDVLVAYTDGASESRDSRGELFSIERIRDSLGGLRRDGEGPADAARRLMELVRSYRAGPASDDTLIVEVTLAPPRGSDPSVGHVRGEIQV
jgi:serine phosphatase RsbU (regulator of sigma subunit)